MRIQLGGAVGADLLSGLRRVRGPNPRSIGSAFAHARFEAGDSDDAFGSDDEDGVTFGLITVGAFRAQVTVNSSAAGAQLDARIHFNGAGSWDAAG